MKALIHNHGGEPCGKVAMYFNGSPVVGEPLRASDITLVDGTHPKPDTPLKCGSCGTAVRFVAGDLVGLEVGYT